jgi:RNA recognition motif-containing protein
MSTKLYVGNLPDATTEAQLRELFGRVGTVKSVTIPMDRLTNSARGFALVEMGTAGEALRAFRLLNGEEVAGHAIRILRRQTGLGRLLGG